MIFTSHTWYLLSKIILRFSFICDCSGAVYHSTRFFASMVVLYAKLAIHKLSSDLNYGITHGSFDQDRKHHH